MIKLIILDYDGTMINLVSAHFNSLNSAIEEIAGKEFAITNEEQIAIYNGLSTKTKLNRLINDKNLSTNLIDQIYNTKQKYTLEYIENNIVKNEILYNDLLKLKNEGYQIYCASNAIYQTIEAGLKKLEIFDLFDYIVGNDNIDRQKPNPDIFLECFLHAKIDPKECLIVEDSKHGREAGIRSCAFLCTVDNETQTTYGHIKKSIDKSNFNTLPIRWIDSRLNILIPCAGAGSRFAQQGYKLPKPLIDVNGIPMIQVVFENLNIDANYIFIVQKTHYEQYNLGTYLNLMVPGCTILQTDGLTEGAACTTLLAKEYINNDYHLLIANSDQVIDWNSADFMYKMICENADGGIITFNQENDKKWSYAKLNENGFVCEVAEKNPISNNATAGIYFWSRGSDYIKYAEQMIAKNISTNGEFYICPIFNEAIQDDKKIITYDIKEMNGIGTPEDLNKYLEKLNAR